MELVAERKKRAKKIPDSFIYEIMDGKPIYYRGYKQAIKLHLNAESVMGASGLQVAIIQFLVRILNAAFDDDNYWVFYGEPGVHIDYKNNLAGDITVYTIKHLPVANLTKHYIDVPAMLQIEVDVQAELEDITETSYIKKKTQKLLDFGTKKVIWILTSAQQVLIAEPGRDWVWVDWDKNVEAWPGVTFCIGAYLRKKGFTSEQLE